ncbi:PREDICTED: cyclin-dependent kinase inhibitor 1 [Mesitornis unicolor]|nr:PREDICTED: cyclin-dependent kinase inhibitor 1 [Mesitornis unicolor]
MPLSHSRAGQLPCSSKVCRNLFGPVEHQQLEEDLASLVRQHLEEAQQRWNFDFETETPLEGPFKWERVFLAEQEVKAPDSESRSSLVHEVSPKDRLGSQSSQGHRAGSPQSLKRGQSTIKDFYSSKRRNIPDKPKP